jgi:hypothetical protein
MLGLKLRLELKLIMELHFQPDLLQEIHMFRTKIMANFVFIHIGVFL